jgi:hypothetical protein
MKRNKISVIFSACLTTLLAGSLVSCNAMTPAKADAETILSGQKAIQGSPPKSLNLSADQARGAFGYDFNRDGVADWVVSTSQHSRETWITHSLSVHLSQPDGTFRQVATSSFDPGDGGDEPWGVSVTLTDSGDLLITNHNTSPFSNSDKRNSYRFRWAAGDFVLQEYAHGYSGHSFGNYRASYIFDLAHHTYRKSDTERCDERLEKPCASATTKRLGNLPTLTLGNFGGYAAVDNVMELEKYAIQN